MSTTLQAIQEYQESGKLKKALDGILELEKDVKHLDAAQTLSLLLMKARLLLEMGWLHEAENTISEADDLIEQMNTIPHSTILEFKVYSARIDRLRGYGVEARSKLQLLLEKLEKKRHFIPKSDFIRISIMIRLELAVISRKFGRLQESLNLLMQCLNNQNDIADYTKVLYLNNLIGRVYIKIGNTNDGFKWIEKSLKELENSTQLHSLRILECTYDSMALGFAYQGNLKKAITFSKDLLNLESLLDTNRCTAGYLFNLLIFASKNGDSKTFKEAFTKLEHIALSTEIEETKQQYLLIKAMSLKKKNRLVYLVKAQELLKSLIERPLTNYEITISALLSLGDILTRELYMTSNPEIIDELKILVSKMQDISRIIDSHEIIGQVMLIQAKIAMIEKNFSQSKDYLNKARQIANDHQNPKLSAAISDGYDSLLNLANSSILNMKSNEIPHDIVSHINISHDLDFSPLIGLKRKVLGKEKPIWLVILTSGGISIFSKSFDPNMTINDQFVAGLVAAIDILGKESLPEQGSVERISYQDHNIVIKRSNGLLFCYAFSKQSWPALEKLERFITSLKDEEQLWAALTRDIPFLTRDEKIALNEISKGIFC